MSGAAAWLRERRAGVPPELADEVERLLDAGRVGSAENGETADPAGELAAAALAGFRDALERGAGRDGALRLLAADAALTYAFEAAAATGDLEELAARVGVRGRLGALLERLAAGGEAGP